ncbi:MAG: Hsp20/alpha crystallin family protein [Kiritimatiellia bacterium]
MQFFNIRFWVYLNAALALVVIVLLIGLLIGRGRASHAVEPAAGNGEMGAQAVDALPALLPPAVRREVDAGRVGVRPVSYVKNAVAPDATENWRMRGMHPQEWARLPASPGMDMTETQNGYLLTFSLPGVRNEDIRLSLTGRVMTVQAMVRDPHGKQVGGMERRVLLPRASGDLAEFQALYSNGVLRICVAK